MSESTDAGIEAGETAVPRHQSGAAATPPTAVRPAEVGVRLGWLKTECPSFGGVSFPVCAEKGFVVVIVSLLLPERPSCFVPLQSDQRLTAVWMARVSGFCRGVASRVGGAVGEEAKALGSLPRRMLPKRSVHLVLLIWLTLAAWAVTRYVSVARQRGRREK